MIGRFQYSMRAGSAMYREYIVDTLSKELAEQKKPVVADRITRYAKDKHNIQ